MKRRLGFLRAPWAGFLCFTGSGVMRKFLVINVVLQKGREMPAAMLVLCLSSRHGAVPGFRQEHRSPHFISFCPRGRELKSLIPAFVALGESPPCSYCQPPDRDQSRVTACLAAALQSCLGQVLLSWRRRFPLSRHWAAWPDQAGNLPSSRPPWQCIGTAPAGLKHHGNTRQSVISSLATCRKTPAFPSKLTDPPPSLVLSGIPPVPTFKS